MTISLSDDKFVYLFIDLHLKTDLHVQGHWTVNIYTFSTSEKRTCQALLNISLRSVAR